MKLHCVRIHNSLPDDKRQKPMVERVLVLAADRDEAMKKAAAYAREYKKGDARITYRNDWEPDEVVTWDYYSGDRKDYPHDAPTALELLP